MKWRLSNASLQNASLDFVLFDSSDLVASQVSLGTQTETDRLQEGLQDTVTAYEMQNKFLNKEVLELNQLRQQAIDREQKLFLESSDWEAKFYQIQSKYLLLLNELHNPQVNTLSCINKIFAQIFNHIIACSDVNLLQLYSDHFAGDGVCQQAGDGRPPAQGA